MNSCSALRTNAIAPTTTAAPKRARWIIIRRPYRSATAPQIGAMIPITSAKPPDIAPAHSPARFRSLTPRSCR